MFVPQKALSNANTSVGLMNKGAASVNGNLSNQGFGANESGITNQTFESPIGSGLFVLLAAGAGYAALKRKKDNNPKTAKK